MQQNERKQRKKRTERNSRKKLQPIGTEQSSFQLNSSL